MSAGAAVAQAAGAAAAIWFSVKLARDAERRAAKVEKDALAREAAAAARAEQAEKEREERRRREEQARQDQAVDAVVEQASAALHNLNASLSFYREQAARTDVGSFVHWVDEAATRQQLQALVPDLAPKVADPALLAAMYRLIKALEPWKPADASLPANELLARLQAHYATIEKTVDDVRSFRRGGESRGAHRPS